MLLRRPHVHKAEIAARDHGRFRWAHEFENVLVLLLLSGRLKSQLGDRRIRNSKVLLSLLYRRLDAVCQPAERPSRRRDTKGAFALRIGLQQTA